MGTWISIAKGWYCPCSIGASVPKTCNPIGSDSLRSSVKRAPRERRKRVEASRSEPNWAKAATSRYWARYSFSEPANFFMILLKNNISILVMRRSEEWIHVRLGSRTDTRDGKTDVDGGTDTTEEQLSLQEDLTVGDGDDL